MGYPTGYPFFLPEKQERECQQALSVPMRWSVVGDSTIGTTPNIPTPLHR